MALLNSIKTLQFDPVIFNQQRCEFRLPDDKVYLSNWRLSDIGATGNADSDGKEYVNSSGAYSLIKSIILYNDNTVIANLYNANDYLAFANIGRTNSNSVNMSRYLNRNKVGYGFDENNKLAIATATQQSGVTPPQTVTQDAATTARAWLDLKLPLPFLAATPVVDGRQFRNLRLVIEWASTASADINRILANVSGSPTLEILRPTIIVDEMIDKKAISRVQNRPIPYINLDSERVVVAKDATTVNQRLRAYDDRRVNRLLMINKVATVNSSVGENYSQAMFGENVQFTLNGQQLIPYKGIDTPMKKQVFLADSWGFRNVPQGAQLFESLGYSDYNSLSDLKRNLAYGGLTLNTEINELQLQYSRKAYSPVSQATVTVTVGNPTQLTFSGPLYFEGTDKKVNLAGCGGQTPIDGEKELTLTSPTVGTIAVDTTGKTGYTAGTVTPVSANETTVSNTAFDLLFWGEVNKVLSVRDNVVSISV